MREDRSDPPIDEIRKIREEISARFDHDPARLVAYLINLQERHRERLIDPDARCSGSAPAEILSTTPEE